MHLQLHHFHFLMVYGILILTEELKKEKQPVRLVLLSKRVQQDASGNKLV